MTNKTEEKQRKRAPSKRSLETRERILDAAEQVFAKRGFDGASIRDIASQAGVQGALVHHHSGSKENLFFKVVSRRAEELARLRLEALEEQRAMGELDLRGIISAFIMPFLELTTHGDPHWRAYGLLIAHVSADERWRWISKACFDPTAKVYLGEISKALPQVSQQQVGAGFVFMVSSLLSICASKWRINDLSQAPSDDDLAEILLEFCASGFLAISRQT